MRLISLFLIAAALCACTAKNKEHEAADRVFINGAIYTANDQRDWVNAVAVKDGNIVYVGSDSDVKTWIGDETGVTDLEGRMLLPGFHDAHAHVLLGGSATKSCSLAGTTSVDEMRPLLTACAESGRYGPEDWVTGGGWPLAAFPDGNAPKEILDELLEGRPAYFVDAFGHNGWVSSRALELAGIDDDTPNPPQSVIVRDPDTGAATGTLREAAMALVEEVIPEPSQEERYDGLLAGLAIANAHGITAIIEPGISESNLALYKEADEKGQLSVRVLVSLSPIDALAGALDEQLFALIDRRQNYRGRNLAVDSVKIYIDGVIETETSFMLEPYLDGSNAPAFYPQAELNTLYQRLDDMGLQVHTHAIGDAAIRSALDAYEYMRKANGMSDNRHQVVHLQLIDEADIPRFGELKVAANFQCMWCYPDVYIDLARDIVGDERVDRFYPVRSIQATGGLLVGGSDWDVSSINPLDAIETAITRVDPFSNSGLELGENENIDLPTAIDMYTRNAAFVMGLEKSSGSIEVGKRADLVVLDRNLFEIPTAEINEARVLQTLLAGELVYSSE